MLQASNQKGNYDDIIGARKNFFSQDEDKNQPMLDRFLPIKKIKTELNEIAFWYFVIGVQKIKHTK